jgi:SAM-dependent methyltransferase
MSEALIRAFHAANAGAMSKAFARGGSYERLAALVRGRERVLDLACGDGALLRCIGSSALGIDVSLDELQLAGNRVAQARAQQLPLGDASIDACTCHLAFMLFDELDRVVAELARVIAPGGELLAVLGGGPIADDTEPDAFREFAMLLPPTRRLGDSRARSEAGWRALFDESQWSVLPFERWELELGGTFDDAWEFLATSYELDADHASSIRERLHARIGDHTRCRVVMFLARALRKRA